MANIFFRKTFPNAREGYVQALSELEEQHARVQPSADRLRITQAVTNRNDPTIAFCEQSAATGLRIEDYALALAAANHLFAFGEVDFQDSLGGQAFESSLGTHLQFGRQIMQRFATADPFLQPSGAELWAEATEAEENDPHHALAIVRMMIHNVALNGTLGLEARTKFDPLAVIQIHP